MARRLVVAALLSAVMLVAAGSGAAAPAGSPDVAALQVALRAHGLYAGAIDGLEGPDTSAGLQALQRRAGLPPSGVLDERTRRALGRLGGPDLGARTLALGDSGWDVAALQFSLAWHGFPSGAFDGAFGEHLEAALRRYQRWAGLPAVGWAGPATIASLRSTAPPRSPVRLSWPLQAQVSDPFGPRGARFHSGVDLPADAGTPVAAAGGGQVTYAGFLPGGWGLLVTVAHGNGVRTLYAHLSRVDVRVGERVQAGAQLGLVGATGDASGPHLHFEVRVRGAAADPLTALA